MADGTTKPIGQIRVGDQVLATNPYTGEQAAKTVTHVWVHNDTLTDLALADGTVLTTTEDHPFWSATDHRYEPADELAPGEKLLRADGRQATVTGLKPATSHQAPAYNLTITDLHTYYVLAGETPVLVHNSGPNCGVPLGGKNGDHLGGEDFHGSEYSLDEISGFVNGHTGDGNPAMGRPSAAEVETALRRAGPRQIEGQNSSRFDYNGVRVIVNWDMPWKSTAYYPGR